MVVEVERHSEGMMLRLRGKLVVAASVAAMIAVGHGIGAAATSAPANDVSDAASTKRLTGAQYARVIADAFGEDLKLGGRFEPEMRVDGLLAIGASKVSVTPDGMEQYHAMATTIANQVLDPARRDQMMPCKPARDDQPDDKCAQQFLSRAGNVLFRRPLSTSEIEIYTAASHNGAEILANFYSGLSLGLAAMLESPQFLFRSTNYERDPKDVSAYRMDGYSKAAQLSFFLWNSAPDAELLRAAGKGELHTLAGLEKQVDRMLRSPRLEAGVRAFFSDFLNLDALDDLVKDTTLYPGFGKEVAKDAKEQTLRTVSHLLVDERIDYRDLFTTKKTFLTRELASLYRVPLPHRGPNGGPDLWEAYQFDQSAPYGGLLTQISFTAMHSPPGRASATLRGKAIREVLLCQHVPPPPGSVDFKFVEDTTNPHLKTARDRLAAHSTNPVCAGCHKITDPMGLALENYDGSGVYRASENGVPLDASGELEGKKFASAAELGTSLRNHPAVTSCLVSRLGSYALGREKKPTDTAWFASLNKQFASDGYQVPKLMRQIALSNYLYQVNRSQTEAATK